MTKRIPLTGVPQHLYEQGGCDKVHVATVYRWHQRGLCGVRLEAEWFAGKLCTTDKAIDAFFERINRAKELKRHRESENELRELISEEADSHALSQGGW